MPLVRLNAGEVFSYIGISKEEKYVIVQNLAIFRVTYVSYGESPYSWVQRRF